MRLCAKCNVEKPVSGFWRQSSRKDGLQAVCIDCMTERHAGWRKAKPEEYRAERSSSNTDAMTRSRKRDPIAQLLRSIKCRAKQMGLEFSLLREHVVIPETCPVLGIPIKFAVGCGTGLAEKDCRPSVDRIDNTKGYTPSNIVVVSYRANRIKSDASLSELLAVAKFYEALDAKRDGDTAGGAHIRPVVDGEQCPQHLPAVQPTPEEENGPLPERDANAGSDFGALLPLRMVVRGVAQ